MTGAGAPGAGRAAPALRDLGFLHMVPTIATDPPAAHAAALDLFVLGERLGFDGAWVFTRHLQRGLSSPVAFLAAASQRTTRIGLGAAVIPLEYERLLTLAEGLATADVLSGGRVEAGVSVHPPRFAPADAARVLGAGWEDEDRSHARITDLRALLRKGDPLVAEDPRTGPGSLWSGRVEPAGTDVADRIWQGTGSVDSAVRAGRAGLDLLLSNVATSADGGTDFTANQRRIVEAYRAEAPAGARVKAGLVVVPTDGATPAQRERYEAYAASRADRPGHLGPGGLLLAPDIVGGADEIAARLAAHLAETGVDELLAILPFPFPPEDHRQIVRAVAEEVGPRLGWTPAR